MEVDLIRRFEACVERGDRLAAESRYEEAFEAYLDALETLGSFLVYRDTGMLVPVGKLTGFLGRYPEVEEAIRRYSSLKGVEEEAKSLREELERLRGMMTLPSSER